MSRVKKGWEDATGKYVDTSFGLRGRGTPGCRYLTKTACQQIDEASFNKKPHEFIESFVELMLGQIGSWIHKDEFPKNMWQWRKDPQPVGKGNKSLEVKLERAIVSAAGCDRMTYQLAATSGYKGPFSSPRHAIDLVEHHSPTSFEFIELKCPRGADTSETPFAAAVELLRYFAAFVAAQNYLSSPENKHLRGRLGQGHVLNAKQLKLTVLGPRHFYDVYSLYSLSKIQRFFKDGLDLYGKRRDWTVSFLFSAFPSSFDWPPKENPGQALKAYNERDFLLDGKWRRP